MATSVIALPGLTIELAAGPRLFVDGIGWLPGPPVKFTRPGDPPTVTLVDRTPSEPWTQNGVRIDVVDPATALAQLREALVRAPKADRDGEGGIGPEQVAARYRTFNARTLRRILATAPRDLPGAPDLAATGERQRWRWRSWDDVDLWLDAWRDHQATDQDEPRKGSGSRRAAVELVDDEVVDWSAKAHRRGHTTDTVTVSGADLPVPPRPSRQAKK